MDPCSSPATIMEDTASLIIEMMGTMRTPDNYIVLSLGRKYVSNQDISASIHHPLSTDEHVQILDMASHSKDSAALLVNKPLELLQSWTIPSCQRGMHIPWQMESCYGFKTTNVPRYTQKLLTCKSDRRSSIRRMVWYLNQRVTMQHVCIYAEAKRVPCSTSRSAEPFPLVRTVLN